jgi:hypothetical protein
MKIDRAMRKIREDLISSLFYGIICLLQYAFKFSSSLRSQAHKSGLARIIGKSCRICDFYRRYGSPLNLFYNYSTGFGHFASIRSSSLNCYFSFAYRFYLSFAIYCCYFRIRSCPFDFLSSCILRFNRSF